MRYCFIEAFCQELSKFIETGEVKKAQEIVMQLARLKSRLAATPVTKPSIIEITIQVESIDDYETPPIRLSIEPEKMTVKDLKVKVRTNFFVDLLFTFKT